MKKSFVIRLVALALCLSCFFALSMASVSASAAESTEDSANQEVQKAQDMPTLIITRIDDECGVDSTDSTNLDSYVEFKGELKANSKISGTFKITNLLGQDISIIAGASNTGGELGLIFESEILHIPCDGTVKVIARYKKFPYGTYRYSLVNETSNTTAAVLNIYKTE